jgi:hypothetical protein
MYARDEMRELELLAKQFSKTSGTVLQNEFSLYQKDLIRDGTKFLREVGQTAKRDKKGKVVLVAVIMN